MAMQLMPCHGMPLPAGDWVQALSQAIPERKKRATTPRPPKLRVNRGGSEPLLQTDEERGRLPEN